MTLAPWVAGVIVTGILVATHEAANSLFLRMIKDAGYGVDSSSKELRSFRCCCQICRIVTSSPTPRAMLLLVHIQYPRIHEV